MRVRQLSLATLVALSLAAWGLVLMTPRPAQAMTLAQMQNLVAALTNAGIAATIERSGTNWTVRANGEFTVNVNAVKTVADAQGIAAFVGMVEFR